MISLQGKNKAEVLAKLYNASRPFGMGFLHYTPEDMTVAEAEELLKKTHYYDYLYGRLMKIDLSGDTLNTRLYDRDLGEGSAARALGQPE